MLQSDPEYIRNIQQKLFDYLLEKTEENKDSLKELIYQCIMNKEFEQFYYFIYQRYEYDYIEDIINNWLLVEYPEDTFAFIEQFITHYTKEEANEWLAYIIKNLIYDGRRNSESRQYTQARQLIDMGLSLYPKEKLIEGNDSILRNYFVLCEMDSEYYASINQSLECKRILEEASGIFSINRIKYQATFLNANFECTYFYCWNNYIHILYMQQNKEDYNNMFNQFFQELLWFYDHQEINQYTPISIRFNLFNQYIRPFVRYELMTNKQKIDYSQKFQEKIMLWKDYLTKELRKTDDFAKCILKTLKHYVAFFEEKQYNPTPLINFIIDNSYRMGNISFLDILKSSSTQMNIPETRNQIENLIIQEKYEAKFTIEEYKGEDEDFNIDDIEINDANEIESDKESFKEEEISDVSKEICKTEKY
ncbi:hypothetical protein KGMB02408_00160 [Bacteroides faecalis]|uniref:Uncharacterized protein n=2 Tax=Bacteroides faecalis TaxID=2447885 RepID=A0A401LNP2_9BACE|nr:hypothetical protein KGMB02408_00160 [Bacteroides faecalis]